MKEQKPWLLGSLSPNKPGKHHPMREVTFSPAEITRVCNASVRESLNLAALWSGCVPRPGSMHRHPSKGQG